MLGRDPDGIALLGFNAGRKLFQLSAQLREFQTPPLQFDEGLHAREQKRRIRGFAFIHHQLITPPRFKLGESRALRQRDRESVYVRRAHAGAPGLRKLRERDFFFGSEVGRDCRAHFVQRRAHAVAGRADTVILSAITPLVIRDRGDTLPGHLFLKDGQHRRCIRQSALQRGVSFFLLAETSHDARINSSPRLLLGRNQQIGSGGVDSLFGKAAGLGQHAPSFQLTCYFEILCRHCPGLHR